MHRESHKDKSVVVKEKDENVVWRVPGFDGNKMLKRIILELKKP